MKTACQPKGTCFLFYFEKTLDCGLLRDVIDHLYHRLSIIDVNVELSVDTFKSYAVADEAPNL